ncbi:hypothetical protein JCM10212_001780 [Sporobolomyces blumeae]
MSPSSSDEEMDRGQLHSEKPGRRRAPRRVLRMEPIDESEPARSTGGDEFVLFCPVEIAETRRHYPGLWTLVDDTPDSTFYKFSWRVPEHQYRQDELAELSLSAHDDFDQRDRWSKSFVAIEWRK